MQAAKAPPSRLHWKLEPASLALKLKLAALVLLGLAGPALIVVSGGAVSSVKLRVAVELVPRGRGLDAALGRILAVALTAMLDGSWPRLKACRNCRWAFHDYSRNRSASWCSMAICGNRSKTRAYRRRKHAG